MIIPLEEPIACEQLCKIIQKVIAKHVKENQSPAKAISINVVEVIEQSDHIPKLEHKCLDHQ